MEDKLNTYIPNMQLYLIAQWRYLLFLTLFVFELHIVTNPSAEILSTLPRLQNLHKVSLSLTLSLEHLAPLYTPQVLSSMVLARTEAAGVQLLDESDRLLTGEMQPVLDNGGDQVEMREMIGKLKSDIVDYMVSERIRKAKAE